MLFVVTAMFSDNESLQSFPTATIDSPSSVHSTVPPSATKKHHSLFYFHSVVFEVEGTLFNVPRYGLPGHAAAFQARFASSSTDSDAPGSSDLNPIYLEAEVEAFDFASLLKATYPPPGQTQSELTVEEWMSVLKLAKMWDLDDTRDRAVAKSERHLADKGPVDKILLGKKHGIIQWLKDGYRTLAIRATGPTEDEREALDLVTLCGILDLRDRAWTWASVAYPSNVAYYRTSYPCNDDVLLEVFGDELRDRPVASTAKPKTPSQPPYKKKGKK